MKKTFVLALGLLVAPQMVSAQFEVGLDAGFGIAIPDAEGADNITRFGVPSGGFLPFIAPPQARVAFAAGENLLVESVLGFNYFSSGDDSLNALFLMPGVNYLVTPQVYVRGEAGLVRLSDGEDSETRYGFGAGVGMRRPLGNAAVVRFEVAGDKWLETEDGFEDGALDVRAIVGISAIIGG